MHVGYEISTLILLRLHRMPVVVVKACEECRHPSRHVPDQFLISLTGCNDGRSPALCLLATAEDPTLRHGQCPTEAIKKGR